MPDRDELHLPDNEETERGAGHAMLHKLLWVAVLVATTLIVASSPLLAQQEPLPAAAASASGACDQTTAQLAKACAQDARADYPEALGVCANLSKPAERDRCLKHAASDLKAAPGECDAQEQVRRRVCQALGQAPYDPVIRPSDFTTNITNAYFPLKPGTVFTYKGQDDTIVVEVLRRTVTILGVRCVVVRDTVTVDGKLEEDTFDYYAQDKTGNVWYFGETTAEYVNGLAVSTDGSFIAGVNGAKPGIIMPANPKPGTTYREEFFLDEAEDVARVERLDAKVKVPYGSFSRTLETFNYVPIEPDARENKYYAPGVGNVLTINLETGEREELVSIKRK